MTRARELANFADNTSGLESLTVSDITDLTATATEINKIDGYTGDHNDLNKIHAFTGTTADLEYAKDLRATGVTTTEFDKLDGLTATTSELNVMDGVTVSTANINSAVNQITDSSTDLNVDSNTLVVDKSANKVGIGTASPSTALDFGVTSAGDNIITLRKNSNSVIGIGAGTGFGVKAFAPSDGTSTNLMFETGLISTGDGTTYTQKGLAVRFNGNVGINTTSPSNKLVVEGNIQIGDWTTSGSRYIGYARTDNASFGLAGASGLEIESASIGGNYSQHLHLWTHFYNGGSGRRMTIRHDGKVGVNKTDPAVQLDVNGNTYIRGNLGIIGNNNVISPENSGSGYLRIHGGGTNEGGAIEFRGGGSAGDLRFLTGTSGAGSERVRIVSGGPMEFRNTAAPIMFLGGHTNYTGTYTQTGIYTNQNNNHDDPANGIFIERRRLADNSTGEISNFTIGSRGGQKQFVLDAHGHVSRGVEGGWRIDQARWRNIGSSWTGHTYLRTPIFKGSSNMFRIKIYVYEYGGSYAGEYVFSGYAYAAGGGSLISTRLHALAGGARGIDMGTSSNGNIWCRVQNSATYYSHYSFDYIGWNQLKPEDFTFSSSAG